MQQQLESQKQKLL